MMRSWIIFFVLLILFLFLSIGNAVSVERDCSNLCKEQDALISDVISNGLFKADYCLCYFSDEVKVEEMK